MNTSGIEDYKSLRDVYQDKASVLLRSSLIGFGGIGSLA